jgi:uncharacterized repeat protein (TIGR03803 family)
VILSGDTLYGTAEQGGSFGNGTVFKLNTDGTGFTKLHSFTAGVYNSDGIYPSGGLILSGDTLYGTANSGGSFGNGTVFRLTTNGTGFKTLHSFTGGSGGDGPSSRLILLGSTLYGATSGADVFFGRTGNGTVFAVNTNGTGFTNLYSFSAVSSSSSGDNTNSDGVFPSGRLIVSGNTLYGAAGAGGTTGKGTVFSVNTDGTGFTTVHNFTAYFRNSDGATPEGLILSGDTLYGTALYGGSFGRGTVFAVNTDGTGFTTLHNFTAIDPNIGVNSDGDNPVAGPILSDNSLYGTAYYGGDSGNGTVFSLWLGSASSPQLTIIRSVANVILTWPTNAAGFALQTSANLDSPNSWIAATYSSVIVGDQYFVTNNISGSAQFYRLKK